MLFTLGFSSKSEKEKNLQIKIPGYNNYMEVVWISYVGGLFSRFFCDFSFASQIKVLNKVKSLLYYFFIYIYFFFFFIYIFHMICLIYNNQNQAKFKGPMSMYSLLGCFNHHTSLPSSGSGSGNSFLIVHKNSF